MLLSNMNEARASEKRLALLIGNERGWKTDSKLDYAIKGDLEPFGRLIKKNGFKIIDLKNGNPEALRKTFMKLKRRFSQRSPFQTFLLYYSGHADSKYLHMGRRRKGKKPLSYVEIRQFFKELRKLGVLRLFGIFDSCNSGEILKLFSGDLNKYKKNITRKSKGTTGPIIGLDIQKLTPQGKSTGIKIMGSSTHKAWEYRKYSSSGFTHFLKKGLSGKKADTNEDGKITFEELFEYARARLEEDYPNEQEPKILKQAKEGKPYAFAFSYNSTLLIGARISGSIRVTVGRFSWTGQKNNKMALKIRLISGKGIFDWKTPKGECKQQKIALLRKRENLLSEKWREVQCRNGAKRKKGKLELSLQKLPYVNPSLPSQTRNGVFLITWKKGTTLLKQREPQPHSNIPWSVFAQGGLAGATFAGDAISVGGSLGLQHDFFNIQLGGWGTSLPVSRYNEYLQLHTALQASIGYKWALRNLFMFTGIYGGIGLLIQDIGQILGPQTGLLLHFGATMVPGIWFSRHWGLFFRFDLGGDFGKVGTRWQTFLRWNGAMGIHFRL